VSPVTASVCFSWSKDLWTQNSSRYRGDARREISKTSKALVSQIQRSRFAIVDEPPLLASVPDARRQDQPNNVEMGESLIKAGAELNESLVAAASIDNRAVAELLLDHGAALDVADGLGRQWRKLSTGQPGCAYFAA